MVDKFSHIFPYPEEKLALFIDGSNFIAAINSLNMRIDFAKVLEFFRKRTHLIRAYYYSAIKIEENGEIKIQKLLDYLAYNNFVVVSKEAKTYHTSNGAKTKGNMDIELAVDVMKITPRVSHIVICTGDGDFLPLVRAVQEQGVRVTAISTVRGSVQIMSDELRKQVDHYIDLEDMRDEIQQ